MDDDELSPGLETESKVVHKAHDMRKYDGQTLFSKMV